MKKFFTLRNLLFGFVLLLLLIQSVRIDKKNPVSSPEKDFMAINPAPAALQQQLISSCYDCHSNHTEYPWYSNIAPVSWWLKHHVNEGREHLNFSDWGSYDAKKAGHKLEECVEMIQEGEMPMSSYTLLHKEAQLSEEQRLMLVNWFSSLRGQEGEKEQDTTEDE